MAFPRMHELDLTNQRVLIREDLNAPIKDGVVTSTKRLEAALPTIKKAKEAGAKVLILAHRGRPVEGQVDENLTLAPVADWLSQALGENVRLVRDYLHSSVPMESGQVVLLENCRFNKGEKANDDALAKQYASLCDIYIMDAFGTAHRAQASTHGVMKHAAKVAAGPLLAAELDALGTAIKAPARPLLAIVAGSKVSTKLTVLDALIDKVDQLIVGGGIANTFLAAQGYDVGNSLMEPELVEAARKIMQKAANKGSEVPLPVDVVVAPEFSASATATVKPVDQVGAREMILDIGSETSRRYAELIKQAGTVVWNGPVGVFEFDEFSQGTHRLADAIAATKAFTLAGGGDTLAAIDKYGIADDISCISTGGGAFLEFLEGKKLPSVVALEAAA